jgi:hypothetical protein
LLNWGLLLKCQCRKEFKHAYIESANLLKEHRQSERISHDRSLPFSFLISCGSDTGTSHCV